MVKKKELKQRAIYVYPPTEMSASWKELADASRVSISKFVIEHVENSLHVEDEDYRSRAAVIEENKQLRETLKEREKRVDHLELLVENLEQDLRLYRARMFTDESYTGLRHYDRKIIKILREPGIHSSDELLMRLRIKVDEQEAVKAVSIQRARLNNTT